MSKRRGLARSPSSRLRRIDRGRQIHIIDPSSWMCLLMAVRRTIPSCSRWPNPLRHRLRRLRAQWAVQVLAPSARTHVPGPLQPHHLQTLRHLEREAQCHKACRRLRNSQAGLIPLACLRPHPDPQSQKSAVSRHRKEGIHQMRHQLLPINRHKVRRRHKMRLSAIEGG